MGAGIKVLSQKLFKEAISPFIYGEFVEFINDLIPGMWAERIRDRSFEGQTNPRMFYRKEKDFPKPAWREICIKNAPFGGFTVHDIADVIFELDPIKPFVGTQSACIRVSGTRNYLAGIAQNIPVRANEKMKLEIYLRGEAVSGKVRIFIGREYGAYPDIYDEVVFENIGRDWKKYTVEITSPVTDETALFAITMDKPGTLWVDKVSLMLVSNLKGWRTDVIEAMRATKPRIIRFGGSSLIYYNWKYGIGPREKRAPFVNTPWNNTEENDVGLDELLQLCELVGAEPLICINVNTAKPEDISEQIEYTNGSDKTKFGKLRAQNGHQKPYNVKYWQIGNEQRGEAYEKALPKFISAMKKADPNIILLAGYPTVNIINTLSKELAYGCPHFYEPDLELHKNYTDKARARIAASPCNPNMKLGITEWNHTAGDWGDPRAWLQTLYNSIIASRMLNHFQRNGDLIRIANRSNLVNSCYSGSIQTKPLDIYFTPTYYVQKLYSNLSGKYAMKVESDNPALDISATMDDKPKRLMLWIANPTDKPIESKIILDEIGKAKSLNVTTITGKTPAAVNSFERKDNVVPVEQTIKPKEKMKCEFPAWSVIGMEFKF